MRLLLNTTDHEGRLQDRVRGASGAARRASGFWLVGLLSPGPWHSAQRGPGVARAAQGRV